MSRPRILGVPTDPITFEAMLVQIEQWINTGDRLHQICTVNPEFIVMAQTDAAFYQVLQAADLCVLDGWGAVWALRGRGIQVPERVTGSDGVPLLMARAADKGWRVFLLGAGEGIAAQAAEILRKQHPSLQIVGTHAGTPHPDAAEQIIQMINAASPDILLVAYGAPQQDQWIALHRDRLRVKVAMGVGGVFDFITENVPRAPLWMRRWGIEWLYRLYLQPSRWKRMLRLPRFAIQALLFGERPPRHARQS